MTLLTPAERLLQDLGVTEPDEIDLEAIAFHVGATIRYRTLEGCEARIIGDRNKAIITVNRHSGVPRKRFSIAHELGHWCHDRGKALVCRVDDYKPQTALSPERIADAYAADLLMPNYLFRPLARRYAKLDFKAVKGIADTFKVSITAAAIRMVESDHAHALLVCHGQNGKKWFARSPSVPARWFPQEALDPDSLAFDVLFGSKPDDIMPRKIDADAWFDQFDASRYQLLEQTVRTSSMETLTILRITDPGMIEERYTSSYGLRR